MNSADLPITEWWDPEWDVYDVPGSLYDQDSPAAHSIWWTCYEHVAMVEWIMTGRSWGWPDKPKELERHAYPGQPSTRTKPPVKPCTCEYHCARWVLPLQFLETRTRTLIDVLGLHGISWITINPDCPQHGEAVRIVGDGVTVEELWNDPWLNVMRDPYDLDDNERTDHA
jgi:hypothetical protein